MIKNSSIASYLRRHPLTPQLFLVCCMVGSLSLMSFNLSWATPPKELSMDEPFFQPYRPMLLTLKEGDTDETMCLNSITDKFKPTAYFELAKIFRQDLETQLNLFSEGLTKDFEALLGICMAGNSCEGLSDQALREISIGNNITIFGPEIPFMDTLGTLKDVRDNLVRTQKVVENLSPSDTCSVGRIDESCLWPTFIRPVAAIMVKNIDFIGNFYSQLCTLMKFSLPKRLKQWSVETVPNPVTISEDTWENEMIFPLEEDLEEYEAPSPLTLGETSDCSFASASSLDTCISLEVTTAHPSSGIKILEAIQSFYVDASQKMGYTTSAPVGEEV